MGIGRRKKRLLFRVVAAEVQVEEEVFVGGGRERTHGKTGQLALVLRSVVGLGLLRVSAFFLLGLQSLALCSGTLPRLTHDAFPAGSSRRTAHHPFHPFRAWIRSRVSVP